MCSYNLYQQVLMNPAKLWPLAECILNSSLSCHCFLEQNGIILFSVSSILCMYPTGLGRSVWLLWALNDSVWISRAQLCNPSLRWAMHLYLAPPVCVCVRVLLLQHLSACASLSAEQSTLSCLCKTICSHSQGICIIDYLS